jgi:tRNA threonylcarbamoyladenosine biosynthesis protein TsaE
VKRQSHSVAETEAIAAELARSFHGGEVVALHGDLGAGKTQFVRGLVRGLGGEPRSVSSPTFVLLNVYDTGRLTVYHLDAYRTSGEEDFEGIGFTELLDQGAVVAIEWPQRVPGLLPSQTWHVTLTPLDEFRRDIEITPPAPCG